MADKNVSLLISNSFFLFSCFIIVFMMIFSSSFVVSGADQMVPGMFVFGDSLVDVGNNNYLESLGKANFPFYGIDFPTKQPTGRFSNGKNAADFLAEKVGLPTSPPYLSLFLNMNNASILTGVSFASGGAGILDSTSFSQTIPLSTQVEHYSEVYQEIARQLGSSDAEKHISKSLFIFVIGSNDIFAYFGPFGPQTKNNPQQHIDLMTASLKGKLKQLYNHGARKFVMVGVPAIGYCPIQRNMNNKKECSEAVNEFSVKYNKALNSTLKELKSELRDMSYSLFDAYSILQNFVQKPAAYGLREVKVACCGLGNLNADVGCLPISKCCPNRRDHLFWDLVHPSEAAVRIAVDNIFDGTSQYAFPINMRQLVTI